MELIILLVLVVGGFLVYRNRVALIARVLGQPEGRIERRLNQRKR